MTILILKSSYWTQKIFTKLFPAEITGLIRQYDYSFTKNIFYRMFTDIQV